MEHDEETGVRLARGVGKQMDAHVRDEGQDALRAMRQANTKERTRADAEEDGCQRR